MPIEKKARLAPEPVCMFWKKNSAYSVCKVTCVNLSSELLLCTYFWHYVLYPSEEGSIIAHVQPAVKLQIMFGNCGSNHGQNTKYPAKSLRDFLHSLQANVLIVSLNGPRQLR
jgi:hypothetical protein